MTARLIDGTALSATIRAEVAQQIPDFAKRHGEPPGLAAVLVGDNPASQVYVRNKRKKCEEVGITSWLHQLSQDTTEQQLLTLIDDLNQNELVNGILVQLPLPPQIDEATIVRAVHPLKDIDGFGPVNLGLLTAGTPRYLPCTPHGVQQMLVRNKIEVAGAHVVILGRSNIVGKPLALILMQKAEGANATVTVCHSRSRNISEITRQADILVAAIGQAEFVKADMIKPGATVIDVGTNRLPNGKLVGDVDFEAAQHIAGAISPVPGGVGPMTIAMLLFNTVHAAKLQVENRATW
jgi:methylenetetrahydrofolate dehydrogenase (NADP+)/methenyltetrahydrofolate cyclohydrolase